MSVLNWRRKLMRIQYYPKKLTSWTAFAQITRLPHRLILSKSTTTYRVFCLLAVGFVVYVRCVTSVIVHWLLFQRFAWHIMFLFFDAHCHEFHFHFKVIYSVHPSLVSMASHVTYRSRRQQQEQGRLNRQCMSKPCLVGEMCFVYGFVFIWWKMGRWWKRGMHLQPKNKPTIEMKTLKIAILHGTTNFHQN